MKTWLLSLTLLTCSLVKAQQTMTVDYEYGFLHPDTTKPSTPVKAKLVVADNLSYFYFPGNSETAQNASTSFGATFNDYAVYTDHEKKYTLIQNEPVPDRQFIIRDTLQPLVWEYKNDFVRTVAGYTCKKAVTFQNGKKITVFYATELPASQGPGIASNLPGTILEVWFEGDPRVLTAKKVELNKPLVITEPGHGKLVSPNGFDKAVARLFNQPGAIAGYDPAPKGYGRMDFTGYGIANQIGISYVAPSPLQGATPAPRPLGFGDFQYY